MFPSLKEVQDFFFEGSALGYAGGGQYQEDPSEPGRKKFVHENATHTLRYVDAYVSNGLKSGGSVIIYALSDGKWKAIWIMHYHGEEYVDSKVLRRFLKEALAVAYASKQFLCGRGLRRYPGEASGDKYRYYNYGEGSFSDFSGYETIEDLEIGKFVFIHYFAGHSLVELD